MEDGLPAEREHLALGSQHRQSSGASCFGSFPSGLHSPGLARGSFLKLCFILPGVSFLIAGQWQLCEGGFLPLKPQCLCLFIFLSGSCT